MTHTINFDDITDGDFLLYATHGKEIIKATRREAVHRAVSEIKDREDKHCFVELMKVVGKHRDEQGEFLWVLSLMSFDETGLGESWKDYRMWVEG